MRILAIGRAECFSPNSVEKDRAIMEAVVSRLRAKGHSPLLTSLLGEELIPLMGEEPTPPQAPLFEAREFFPGKSSSPKGEVRWGLVLSMGRLPETLRQLRQMELAGVRVINSPQGVERCARSRLKVIMQEQGIPMAPAEGPDGYWLKRGDAAAQSHSDVVFAADREQLEREIAAFRRRGIDDYTVEAHVVGDVVKFYGVRGTGFFRYYYPTDDGDQKFGDEARNGAARHYPFSEGNLQLAAERLAAAVGVDIYGGDCIVRADGSFCVIDFNDWPSFSRCRDEAAEAIVSMIEKMRK